MIAPGVVSTGPRRSGRAIRVLVVDDSAVVRSLLSRQLSRETGIEVVGTAPDPYAARNKIVELEPDVLTLDLEMPRMDGITFLHRLMQYRPMPVIVISSLTGQGTDAAVAAMAAGAVDVLAKPASACSVNEMSRLLVEKIRIAATARVRPAPVAPPAERVFSVSSSNVLKIIALGASTGGVQALTEILTAFPGNAPGTLVVQHMPPKFTRSFAQRLNALCAVEVKEAADGDSVIPGRVLFAPGGLHMLLRRSGNHCYVQVKDGPPVYHQRPSVDVLFNSVARHAGPYAVGAILTGMGCDGAEGLLAMHRAGARTVAQDEGSSIVYGMPMEAMKCGAAESIVPLNAIAKTLMLLAGQPLTAGTSG